jgi:p-aminobenzoyl-glutamate transporter AbgT
VVGVITMTVGVVLFGALTAFLADKFIRPRTSEAAAEQAAYADVQAQLSEISRELKALRDEVVSRPKPPNDDR